MKMHVNKKTEGNAMMVQMELGAAMSALHLVHVTIVELPAVILLTNVVWGVLIPMLQLQQQQQQQQQ